MSATEMIQWNGAEALYVTDERNNETPDLREFLLSANTWATGSIYSDIEERLVGQTWDDQEYNPSGNLNKLRFLSNAGSKLAIDHNRTFDSNGNVIKDAQIFNLTSGDASIKLSGTSKSTSSYASDDSGGAWSASGSLSYTDTNAFGTGQILKASVKVESSGTWSWNDATNESTSTYLGTTSVNASVAGYTLKTKTTDNYADSAYWDSEADGLIYTSSINQGFGTYSFSDANAGHAFSFSFNDSDDSVNEVLHFDMTNVKFSNADLSLTAKAISIELAGDDYYLFDNVFGTDQGDDIAQLAANQTDLVLPELLTGANVVTLKRSQSFSAGEGNDTVTGSSSADVIFGDEGNDAIVGGAGDDVIFGGSGQDILTGGLGADTFFFDNLSLDTIKDFKKGQDMIGLANEIFSAFSEAGLDEVSSGNLVVSNRSGDYAALDADDFLIYNTVNDTLYYDADGNGSTAAIAFAKIVLSGKASPLASDFLLFSDAA